MIILPHWVKENGLTNYSIIRCPKGHDNLDELKRMPIKEAEQRRVRMDFKCRECGTEFSEESVFIYSEESIGYEPPGVVSGDEVKSYIEYEKRKKALRKRVYE